MLELGRAGLKDAISSAGISGFWTDPGNILEQTGAKGAYLLTQHVATLLRFESFPCGPLSLTPGWYLYAGSAWGSGGIRARLGRHFRQEKKPHWHIDHLTLCGEDISALAVPDGRECDLVDRLLWSGEFRIAAPGFGSSDCRRCESHLLRFETN